MRVFRTTCLLVVLGVLGPSPAFAQESDAAPAAAASATVPRAETPPEPAVPPAPASPALDLSQPPAQPDQDESLVDKWWFWTALGAAVIGTVVAVVLIDSGSSTPRTTLGNREFRP